MSFGNRNAAHYKVPVKKLPKAANTETVESRYWKSFKYPITIARTAAITCVEMIPNSTKFVALHGTAVDIMDPRTSGTEPYKSLTRFKDKILTASIRNDAKLFAVAGKEKHIGIYELDSRSNLRTLRGHSNAVQTIKFSASKAAHLVSGSHDKTVRLWDYSSETCVSAFHGHTDYVTRVIEMPNSNGNLWCSSSYDQTIRLWDFRTSSHQLSFDQGAPVEDILFIPSTFMLASAGLNGVLIWDILGGSGSTSDISDSSSSSSSSSLSPSSSKVKTEEHDDDEDTEAMRDMEDEEEQKEMVDEATELKEKIIKHSGPSGSIKPIARLQNHQKAVTTLRFDGTKSRLLSGSIDHNIKVYDLQTFSVTHTFKNHAPVLSFDISYDNSTIAVGMADGVLSMRKRIIAAEGETVLPPPSSIYNISALGPISEYKDRLDEAASFRASLSRGASEFDFRIDVPKKVRLEVYEGLLKDHRYKEALDSALETKNPLIVVSLIETMMASEGLSQSLDGRDEEELLPILEFLTTEITDPRFSGQLITLSHIVLDTYAPVIGQSFVVDKLFFQLQDLLHQEIKTQMLMQQLNGVIEMIINNATVSQSN